MPDTKTKLPEIEPEVKKAVETAKANMNASFRLNQSDTQKLPDKPWLNWVLLIIPVCLLFSIVILSYAYFIKGRNIQIPFFSSQQEDSLEKFVKDSQTGTPKVLTAEEKLKSQRELITSLAQKSDTLTLKDCKPDPTVLEIQKGQTLTVVNQDSKDRTIEIDKSYLIPANGSLSIIADFNLQPQPPAAYSYSCDQPDDVVGYIIVR